ncbi:glycosyl transferase, family 2 [Thermosinus carboxydivorans Nor1]|uniref:Glycosyl transferase, family 2 n=1 Tax=Thermosinus carboxydivorans Nor1 TaxID=401526 RepID=A1HSR9_9FIRM|nr:TPR domain-containing glycosyltransferase [Thermosinus carboxydivorans]EAX46950.1 glycosyl transferase, family 2 [Thermosinus carboxydivorans Nor1]
MVRTISLCMIVKDEEANLARCLNSVRGAVDEIVVVDTGSTDRTRAVAELAGAKVISRKWQDDFSAARNASLELATGDWILFLDADEELAPGSADVLRRVITDECEGYFMKVVNFIGAADNIETVPDLVFRMFRNKPEYRFRGAIHEQIVDVILEKNKQAIFKVAEGIVIRHYGYLQQHIIAKDKINRNLSIITRECANDPDNKTLRYHYGVELYRAERYLEAADELAKVAAAVDSGVVYYPKLLRYIALAYYGAREYELALAAITKGLQLFPDYADLYYYGGIIQLEQQAYAGAWEWFQRAIATPEQPAYYASFAGCRGFRAYYQLGALAEMFGDEEEALRYYILSLRDNAEFALSLKAIVRILNPRKYPEYAMRAIEKICEFCTADAYRLIGMICFAEGAYELALNYFEKIDSSSIEAYTEVLKAICLIQQQRLMEAIRILDKMPPGHPQFPLAQFNKIVGFWLLKNRKKVRSLCDEFLAAGLSADASKVVAMLKDSLYTRRSVPLQVLGKEGIDLVKDIVLRALDRRELALAQGLLARLDKTVQKEYALELSHVFSKYEYWDIALEYAELYLQEHDDSAEAWFHLAEILVQTNQFERGSLCYHRAITIDTRRPQYYVKLIKLYQAMRRKLLGDAAQQFPQMPIFKQLLEEAPQE